MAGTTAQSKAERVDKIRRSHERRMAVLKSRWDHRRRPLSKKELKRLALTPADLGPELAAEKLEVLEDQEDVRIYQERKHDPRQPFEDFLRAEGLEDLLDR